MQDYFIQNEDQRAILATVRRFVEDEVKPRAGELDAAEDPRDCFSPELVQIASDLGIRTMTLDEEYGGLGIDSVTTAMVIEELGRGDTGVSVLLAQTLKIAQVMQRGLSEEQKARVLPALAEDPQGLLAIGITEPDLGSDYFIPHPRPFGTKAVKTEGGWIINGMKHFISNGSRAKFYLLFTQTEKGKGLADGATCFLLEHGQEGFTYGQTHDKMGERLTNNAELIFTDCFVPDADVVGEVGKGFEVMAAFFRQANAYAAATIVGLCEALYEKAHDWASVRVQGGKPLIEHDGIRAQIAEMRAQIDATRSLILRACWLADNPEHGWSKELSVFPKVLAAQVSWQIATWTLEIHGGHGYMKEFGVAKLVRDAAAGHHTDGVNRTLLLKAANFMWKD